jgi:hypothetical protein
MTLDWNRLLGFEQIADRRTALTEGRIGAKVGGKGGVFVGRIGSKVGGKGFPVITR